MASNKSDGNTHQQSVLNDPYLKFSYEHVYSRMLKLGEKLAAVEGPRVEIGSAGGFLKLLDPSVITSDIRTGPNLQVVLDAQSLPFNDSSISQLLAKDCLHHIPDVSLFFSEVERVLTKHGVLVCVEPYWGPLARLVYRYFHPEPFDADQVGWRISSSDPMDSNQALLYLLLRRDRDKFRSRFPNLEVIEIGPLIGPSYILSGGANHRSVLPTRLLKHIAAFENRTTFWRKSLALGYLVAFKRK